MRASGVNESTLRAWERRYAFPAPRREPSGHRRYSRGDVERILRVLTERKRGASLPIAIERARGASTGVHSLFARMRELHPDLQVTKVRKRHLIQLARAMEEESAARADRPLLIGAFQRERFYRQTEHRWRELARGASHAMVLADFPRVQATDAGPIEVPVERSHPVSREWALISDAPEHCSCLLAWEPPAHPVADPEREFEVVFSVHPGAVREAAETAVAIVAPLAPGVAAPVRRHLEGIPVALPEAQLALAEAITVRLLARLA